MVKLLLELQNTGVFILILILNYTGKCLARAKQLAVPNPQRNCSIDFDHFDILASDTNKFRLLKESLLIKADQP